ncbi:MAG TPA: hypothetical protein VGK74_20805 [Symbiobacteriaceae bacterium]|jgi:hypothetical protein
MRSPRLFPEPADGPLLPELVDERLTIGLAWINDHLAQFLPADRTNPDDMKELTELALLYGLMHRWLGASRQSWLEPIRQVLVAYLADPVSVHSAQRQPHFYNPYFLLYLAVRGAGLRTPAFEAALRRVRRAGYPRRLEMLPYRELEMHYLQWRAGLTSRAQGWGPLFRATTLGRASSPVYMAKWQVYSITHALFYLTDFAGPAAGAPAEAVENARLDTEALLVHFWREQDWDLTGELLLNLVALDGHDTPLFQAGATALLSAWRPEGFLPGPHYAGRADRSTGYRFKTCYHTTLVGLLFCGAYLYRKAESRQGGEGP